MRFVRQRRENQCGHVTKKREREREEGGGRGRKGDTSSKDVTEGENEKMKAGPFEAILVIFGRKDFFFV